MLRAIPEDRSDVQSSLALNPASGNSTIGAGSSTLGVDAGRAGSTLSDARAELPEATQEQGQQQTNNRLGTASPHRRRRPRRKLSSSTTCVLLSTLVVVIAAVVAIILVSVVDRNDSDDSVPDDDAIATPPPTVDPEVVRKMDTILSALSTMEDIVTVSPSDPLNGSDSETPPSSRPPVDPMDPRVLAREWMLRTDLLRDEYLDTDSSKLIVQRFVLVEFWFATNGNAWTNATTTMTDDASTNNETVAYLTPEKPECDWEGVICITDDDSNEVVRRLILPDRNLTGTLPDSMYILSDLGELNLANNNIGGTIPTLWFTEDNANMYNLFKLDLDGNELAGQIPPHLWSQTLMRLVFLNDNNLVGEPFGSNYNHTARGMYLEEIWLQGNNLKGPLPDWLFSHPRLTHFWADNNQFTGSLPQVEDTADALIYVGLSNNSLTGPLLGELLSVMPTLEFLYLDQNQLSGDLPEIDYSQNRGTIILKDLWLHENAFVGMLPPNFGVEWTTLQSLRLEENPGLIGGSITEAQCLQWAKSREQIVVDCPPMTCACCTNPECN